jgi:hypothetical protein
MADRLAALDGTLHVSSSPGHGTSVSGRLRLQNGLQSWLLAHRTDADNARTDGARLVGRSRSAPARVSELALAAL